MEERELRLGSGFTALTCVIIAFPAIAVLFLLATNWPFFLLLGFPAAAAWLVSLRGFIVNGPNQARVVQLFGTYVGTLREVGFFTVTPSSGERS